jgi:SAM-dependent methyltransferase
VVICPDCAAELSFPPPDACASCDWRPRGEQGIPEFFSSADRESSLLRGYLENYNEIAQDDLAESIQETRVLQMRTEQLFSYLGDVRGLSVCDLGVGQGRLVRLILEAGAAEVTGVDIAFPYLSRLNRTPGLRLLIANAENLPFAGEFDLLVAADVLEHVFSVGDALLSMRRALRIGGRLALRVPYKEELIQYARLRGLSKYRIVHLRDFNRDNLRRQLEGAGFEIEGFRFDAYYPSRKRRLLKHLGRLQVRADRALRRRYDNQEPMTPAQRRIAGLLIRPLEITVLARKLEDGPPVGVTT